MTTRYKTRRRWFGAFCLFGAMALLVLGETLLNGRIAGLFFLTYWLTCLALTLLAMVAALLDAAAIRAENRERQRALIESTLREIEERRRFHE